MMTKPGAPIFSAVNGPCASAYSASIHALLSCIATGDMVTSFSMAAFYPGAPHLTCKVTIGTPNARMIARACSRRSIAENASLWGSSCAEQVIMRPAAACDWSPRQRRSIWVGAAHRLAVAALLPPLAYAASSPGCELDCLVHELDGQSYQAQALQTMLAEFLQEVLLEVTPATEECKIGFSLLVLLVLKSSKFDSAHKVGNLGKSVEIWTRFAIHQSLLRERIFKGTVQGSRYQALTVVIIDLHHFEPLKPLQFLEKEIDNISLHFLLKCDATSKLTFAIHECLVAEGNVSDERGETEQIARPFLNPLIREAAVPMRQRYKMELPALQAPITKQLFVSGHFSRDIIRLIVENKGQDVVLGVRAKISGLINENGKLAHLGCLQKQESRGDPPALDGSPNAETHHLYTTRRFDYSIVTEHEHMFSIEDANTCSPYRKAA